MSRWIRKGWIILIIIIIFSAFTPQIIDFIYSKNALPFTATTFTKQDLLLFYGSFLTFIGTVALGSLALWQNAKLSKINEQQGEEIKRNTKRPFFVIQEAKHISESKYLGSKPDGSLIKNEFYLDFVDLGNQWKAEGPINKNRKFDGIIEIKNIGDGIAIDVEYKIAPFVGLSTTNNCIVNINEKFEIPIEITLSYGSQVDYLIVIKYRNILGCTYFQFLEYSFTEFPSGSNSYQVVIQQISEQFHEEYLEDFETKLDDIELKYYSRNQKRESRRIDYERY